FLNAVTSSPPAILNLLNTPVITSQPQSLTVTNGDPASFFVTVQSAAPPNYIWRSNGTVVSCPSPVVSCQRTTDNGQLTTLSLTINSAQPSNAGGYDLIISNNAGSVTSLVATLNVDTLDFGDAPAPYPTRLVNNGARHRLVPGMYLGA